MVQRLKQVLDSFQLDENDPHYVLAISGGMDSMVLLTCFQHLDLKMTIVHYNYGFRANSIHEAELVRSWCLDNRYPFYMKIHDLSSRKKWDKGLQSDARRMRYLYLQEVLEKVKGDFIVTAHHLNDSIETFLINALRGSGTKGLKGIPHKNDKVIRPLLDFTRDEIDQYAQRHDVPYIDDPSNASSDYMRNAIRNEVVLPYLNVESSRNGMKGLARSLSHLEETEEFLDGLLTDMKDRHVRVHSTHISINHFDEIAPFILRRFLRNRGFWDWQAQLLSKRELMHGKRLVGRCEIVQRREKRLILTPIEADEANIVFERAKDLSTVFEVNLIDDVAHFDIPASNTVAVFCRSKLTFPLRYRNWIPGDRIQPLGMYGKHRKVQDVLTDLKIPANVKSQIKVLEDGNGHILWIPEYARSIYALVDKNTPSLICLSLRSSA